MQEMPEVQGLVDFLRGRVVGHAITRATVSAITALTTYDPPITDLQAATESSVERHGKCLDLGTNAAPPLVFLLSTDGWLLWYDTPPTPLINHAHSPIPMRLQIAQLTGVK